MTSGESGKLSINKDLCVLQVVEAIVLNVVESNMGCLF